MVEAIFWIVVSFSDGGYNKGSMSELSIHFKTEESCKLSLEEINALYSPQWRNNTIGCIKIDNNR